MIILMNLLNKNDKEAIYAYGEDEKHLDGKMRIDLQDNYKSSILSFPSDPLIDYNWSMKAMAKLIRQISDFPNKVCYAC